MQKYLDNSPSLIAKYAAERELSRLPVRLPDGAEINLKSGGQNHLIKSMIEDFCGYFAQGAEILYVGDAGSKLAIFEEDTFRNLGVNLDHHGKFPDLVVYQKDKNWLFLMEACSTHGPVEHTRYSELSNIFSKSSAELIYVSCFPDRKTMRRFFADLAWETEAWIVDSPTHMIHLNGHKFLGPYNNDKQPINQAMDLSSQMRQEKTINTPQQKLITRTSDLHLAQKIKLLLLKEKVNELHISKTKNNQKGASKKPPENPPEMGNGRGMKL